MNTVELLLAKPVFQALGWALIHFLWQGAIVAALYAGLRTFLKKSSANARYAAACAALAVMLFLPLATMLAISPSLTDAANGEAPQPAAQMFAPAADAHTASQATPASGSVRNEQSGIAASESLETAQSFSFPQWARERFDGLLPWLVALWFAGVLFLSFRFLGGLFVARQLKQIGASPLVEQWQEKLSELCKQLRVSRPVRLCESLLVEVPTVVGWLRPVILVPASALTGLSQEQLQALLAHELAHIRRHDYLVNLLQTAVETLLFYHPAVWWVSGQIREERENCCDDAAVAACGNVLVYVRALAELEQLRGVAPQLAMAANGGSLLCRIQRLVGKPTHGGRSAESWLAGVIALVTIFGILAGAQTRLLLKDTYAAVTETVSDLVAPEPQSARENSERGLPGNRQAAAAPADDEQAPDEAAEEDSSMAEPEVEETAAESDESQQESAGAQDFLGELAALGYTNISIDDLIAFKTHGVTPEFIRAMNSLMNKKLEADDLVALKIHGVTSQFADEMKAVGYANLSADDLVAFRIHGVTPKFIAEWKDAGYDRLSPDELTAFRIHGVSPAILQEVKGLGFDRVSPDDLVGMRIHGVTPEFVREMRGVFRENLSIDDLTGMRIHGVTPEFVKQIGSLGFSNLSADDVVGFRIHGVTPQFIEGIRAQGFQPTADQLTGLRIHGVTPQFIQTVKERGFTDVTLDQIIELKRLNIIPGARSRNK
ncbi:MAG TPA: M56 family metallopeptidase [Blastocatellia bacterium]|nr:M56 family metallopeptidase [Blastocatellia bacterium]